MSHSKITQTRGQESAKHHPDRRTESAKHFIDKRRRVSQKQTLPRKEDKSQLNTNQTRGQCKAQPLPRQQTLLKQTSEQKSTRLTQHKVCPLVGIRTPQPTTRKEDSGRPHYPDKRTELTKKMLKQTSEQALTKPISTKDKSQTTGKQI